MSAPGAEVATFEVRGESPVNRTELEFRGHVRITDNPGPIQLLDPGGTLLYRSAQSGGILPSDLSRIWLFSTCVKAVTEMTSRRYIL